jgi:hypothetical protein
MLATTDGTSDGNRGAGTPGVEQLLRSGAAAELKLLKQERKAEKQLAAALAALAEDDARLRRAQARLQQRREDVAKAEMALLEAQARRAAGPAGSQD